MAHMSYSRATHTPASPSFPTDGSYFPTDDNGASPNPHPFRYSREQILGLYDEEKFKTTPIELVELLEQGSVLVSPHINRPIAMRDLTEAEKKASHPLNLTCYALTIQIYATSVHPPIPRRAQQAPSTPSAEQGTNGPARRSGQAGIARDPTQPNGRGFGNFGRGDGGILSGGGIKSGVIGGGAVASPAGDGKAPGVLGGGFGGVGKRLVRGRNDGADSPSGEFLVIISRSDITDSK
jgi:PERQ amino acid-rich with GYF domain-containing protein